MLTWSTKQWLYIAYNPNDMKLSHSTKLYSACTNSDNSTKYIKLCTKIHIIQNDLNRKKNH